MIMIVIMTSVILIIMNIGVVIIVLFPIDWYNYTLTFQSKSQHKQNMYRYGKCYNKKVLFFSNLGALVCYVLQ